MELDEKKRWMKSEDFVKIMEAFIKRYQDDVKNNKDNYIWKDEKLLMWHIIKDAYDMGHRYADDYWRNTLWKLTDAEDHFFEEASKKIY